MPRYIDADALREEINSLSVTLCGKELFGELAKHSVLQKIDEAPTVDATPKSEWISVDERLPKDDGAVFGIVRGKHRNVELRDAIELVCYFADEGIWALWDDARVTIQVTHWMPLPEPPKMKGV